MCNFCLQQQRTEVKTEAWSIKVPGRRQNTEMEIKFEGKGGRKCDVVCSREPYDLSIFILKPFKRKLRDVSYFLFLSTAPKDSKYFQSDRLNVTRYLLSSFSESSSFPQFYVTSSLKFALKIITRVVMQLRGLDAYCGFKRSKSRIIR